MFKTSLSPADAQALLDSFAPVIYLHGEEEYFPCSVEWFLQRVTMTYETLVTRLGSANQKVTALVCGTVTDTNVSAQTFTCGGACFSSGLADPAVRIETDFCLPVTDPDATYPGQNQVANGALVAPPPVYGAVIDGPLNGGSTPAYYDLLYAFCYAYNGPAMNGGYGVGEHEGDWEHIYVRLASDRRTVLGAYYQAHRSTDPYSLWYYPPGSEVGPVFQYLLGTTRPIVYSSLFGHSSYVAAGDWTYAWYRGTDHTQGPSQGGILWNGAVEMIDPSIQPWLLYSGFWGSDIAPQSKMPPTGPLMQGWFNSRSDGPAQSVVVPISLAAAQGQHSRVSPTSNFTLGVPAYVQWRVQIENPAVAGGIVFNISEDISGHQDQRVLSNVHDGLVTWGQNKYTSRLYVSSLRYVTASKTYTFKDVFDAIDLDTFNVTATVTPYQSFLQQLPTAISPEDMANYGGWGIDQYQGDGQPDLYAVQTQNTASQHVEVQVLDASSKYSTTLLSAVTPITVSDAGNFVAWFLADFDGDEAPELYGIRTQQTQSNMVEVWVLDGASGYQSIVMQAVTPISCADAANFRTNWCAGNFGDNDCPDLYAICVQGTASGQVEVWTLTGASGYATATPQATPIAAADADNYCAWAIDDYDADGTPDLFALAGQTASGRIEVSVLDGADAYQRWLLQAAPTLIASSQIAQLGDQISWLVRDYDGDGAPDIVLIGLDACKGGVMVQVLDGEQVG